MKRTIFTLTMLFVLGASGKALAQGGTFMKEGKRWVYDMVLVHYRLYNIGQTSPVDWDHQEFEVYVKGDTVIDGRAMKKMYARADGTSRYFCSAYEEGNVVYRCFPDEKASPILNLMTPGDYYNGSSVEWQGTLPFGSGDLAVWQFKWSRTVYEGKSVPCCFVEGVGPSDYLWMERLEYPNCYCDYFDYVFKACYEGDECIFTAADFDRIEKLKETTGIGGVSVSANPTSEVYDLQGRRVRSPQKPGIYVSKGWKYVVK